MNRFHLLCGSLLYCNTAARNGKMSRQNIIGVNLMLKILIKYKRYRLTQEICRW